MARIFMSVALLLSIIAVLSVTEASNMQEDSKTEGVRVKRGQLLPQYCEEGCFYTKAERDQYIQDKRIGGLIKFREYVNAVTGKTCHCVERRGG
jgi:hypothetical protein